MEVSLLSPPVAIDGISGLLFDTNCSDVERLCPLHSCNTPRPRHGGYLRRPPGWTVRTGGTGSASGSLCNTCEPPLSRFAPASLQTVPLFSMSLMGRSGRGGGEGGRDASLSIDNVSSAICIAHSPQVQHSTQSVATDLFFKHFLPTLSTNRSSPTKKRGEEKHQHPKERGCQAARHWQHLPKEASGKQHHPKGRGERRHHTRGEG